MSIENPELKEQNFEVKFEKKTMFTDADVNDFARLSHDHNPLHFSGPDAPVHGELINARVSGAVWEAYGDYTMAVETHMKAGRGITRDEEFVIQIGYPTGTELQRRPKIEKTRVPIHIVKKADGREKIVAEGYALIILTEEYKARTINDREIIATD